jgi:hypothetical protein
MSIGFLTQYSDFQSQTFQPTTAIYEEYKPTPNESWNIKEAEEYKDTNEQSKEVRARDTISLKGGTPDSLDFKISKPEPVSNSVNLSHTKEIRHDESEPSLQYRKLQRRPILDKLTLMADNFVKYSDSRDAAAFYSGIKEELNKLWGYLSVDEPLTQAVVTVESALKYNKWNELSDIQTRVLTNAIKIIVLDKVTGMDVNEMSVLLQKQRINQFPYEEEQA